MSSNNSANSSPGNPAMGNSPVFLQIFIAFIVLCSVFIVVCVVRCLLLRLRVTSRRHNSFLDQKRSIGGLDSSAIAALPTFPYIKYVGDKDGDDEEKNVPQMECSICLSAVEEGEVVKLLPSCMHSFHGDCVGLWLSSRNTCPVCRHEVLGSTSAVQYEPNQIEVVVVPVLNIERQP